MLDRRLLLDATRGLLDCVSPWVRAASVLDWDSSQGFFPVIRRSMIRRQFESLDVAATLVESEHGYAAVPLLRPACEELFWVKYLSGISESDAHILSECLIGAGLLRDLEAQAGEVGDQILDDMGLRPALMEMRSRDTEIRDLLRDLGRRLGWPSRSITNGDVPSAWFISRSSGSETLYRYLFHATSRYVHFSAIELARRGWGRPGRLELASQVYEPVWAQFSLSWGTRLFGWTLEATSDSLQSEGVPELDHASLQAAFNKINEIPLVPLVTPDELAWVSHIP